MRIALVLLLLVATGASAAAPPRVRPVTVPPSAVVNAPWRAVVSIRPAARATLEARGPTRVRAKLKRTGIAGRYAATLRFAQEGTWTIRALIGKRAVRIGRVQVDVARDPLLADPFTITVEQSGALLVGNLREGTLVRLRPGGRAATVAAEQVGHLTRAPDGTIYALAGQALFRLDGTSLTRIAGDGRFEHLGDGGPALAASFAGTTGATVDPAGNVYVGEYEGWIRRIAPNGTISTLAGTGEEGYAGDGGPAAAAAFNRPHGLALAPGGAALYVADTLNGRIRRVDLVTGLVSTLADVGGYVVSLAVAADGTVYAGAVEQGSGVTAVSPSGAVTRLWSGDATNVALAPDGRLYVVSNPGRRIFRLDPATRRTQTVARG